MIGVTDEGRVGGYLLRSRGENRVSSKREKKLVIPADFANLGVVKYCLTPHIFIPIIKLRIVLIRGDVYHKWSIVGKLETKRRVFLLRKEGLWRKKLGFLEFNSDSGEHLGVGSHYIHRFVIL